MKRVLKGESVFNRPCNRSCQVLNQGRCFVPVKTLACKRKAKVRLDSADGVIYVSVMKSKGLEGNRMVSRVLEERVSPTKLLPLLLAVSFPKVGSFSD